MNQVGGSGDGDGGADGLPHHQRMQDVVDLGAGIDPQFVMLRRNMREKIFEFIVRKGRTESDMQRRLPELARRLEDILFRKFPDKNEYYNMMKGAIEPQLQFAIKTLSAQNQRNQQNQQISSQIASSSSYGTMILTPGTTQGANDNSRMSYITDNTGLSSSGAGMVPQNANMGTSLPGEVVDEHVNNSILPKVTHTSPTPVKEVPKEPKFSCPVCMEELIDASSTVCGHIFCRKCIESSIQAQKKCPTCRRKLTMKNFHQVYLPTMDH